jgi:hypothetical protein
LNSHRNLIIADVRITLSGLTDASAFPPSFQAFGHDTSSANLDCEVICGGPDDCLMSNPPAPDKPWSFSIRDGICELVRRNPEGETLWRIAGPLAFERATVTWNPLRFTDVYGSYERAWGTGLGLSLLVLRLRTQGGLILHGMAAEVDGQGILCVGISGTGKSTLAQLLDDAKASVLTDERPILRQWPPPPISPSSHGPHHSSICGSSENATSSQPPAFRIYGSPWPSSAGFARNTWAPLRRIYFIEHGETDRLMPLSPRGAVGRMIHVATIPWQDPVLLDPCLTTVDALLRSVPCAVLAFRPTPAIVDIIRADLHRP